MLLECPICGRLRVDKDWKYCGNGHKEVAMYEVLQVGKGEKEGYKKKLEKQGLK